MDLSQRDDLKRVLKDKILEKISKIKEEASKYEENRKSYLAQLSSKEKENLSSQALETFPSQYVPILKESTFINKVDDIIEFIAQDSIWDTTDKILDVIKIQGINSLYEIKITCLEQNETIPTCVIVHCAKERNNSGQDSIQYDISPVYMEELAARAAPEITYDDSFGDCYDPERLVQRPKNKHIFGEYRRPEAQAFRAFYTKTKEHPVDSLQIYVQSQHITEDLRNAILEFMEEKECQYKQSVVWIHNPAVEPDTENRIWIKKIKLYKKPIADRVPDYYYFPLGEPTDDNYYNDFKFYDTYFHNYTEELEKIKKFKRCQDYNKCENYLYGIMSFEITPDGCLKIFGGEVGYKNLFEGMFGAAPFTKPIGIRSFEETGEGIFVSDKHLGSVENIIPAFHHKNSFIQKDALIDLRDKENVKRVLKEKILEKIEKIRIETEEDDHKKQTYFSKLTEEEKAQLRPHELKVFSHRRLHDPLLNEPNFMNLIDDLVGLIAEEEVWKTADKIIEINYIADFYLEYHVEVIILEQNETIPTCMYIRFDKKDGKLEYIDVHYDISAVYMDECRKNILPPRVREIKGRERIVPERNYKEQYFKTHKNQLTLDSSAFLSCHTKSNLYFPVEEYNEVKLNSARIHLKSGLIPYPVDEFFIYVNKDELTPRVMGTVDYFISDDNQDDILCLQYPVKRADQNGLIFSQKIILYKIPVWDFDYTYEEHIKICDKIKKFRHATYYQCTNYLEMPISFEINPEGDLEIYATGLAFKYFFEDIFRPYFNERRITRSSFGRYYTYHANMTEYTIGSYLNRRPQMLTWISKVSTHLDEINS